MDGLAGRLDAHLRRLVGAGKGDVPGIVAMVTNRDGNIYEGAFGRRSLASGAAMTADTVFALFSATKAITGTAVLQCVEDGLLDLDAPARCYVPSLGELRVLEGFAEDGTPRLRPPRGDITTRQLMLHTAGFGYAFCNAEYRRLTRDHGYPSIATGTRAALRTPLLFDPGTRWEYGSSIDWAGQVVEAIRSRTLGDVLSERVFEPLGIRDTAFVRSAAMKSREAGMHARGTGGRPFALPEPDGPEVTEVQMGGHGLYGTVEDYMRFIRMWLNDGEAPAGRVLRPETVEMAVRNGLDAHQKVARLCAIIPSLSNDAEFFPGLPKSWSYTFMVNDAPAPTGRPAGSVGWAGLPNLFYWIDRETGIGGFWATQILPFFDQVSITGYLAFETEVYKAVARREV